MKHQFYFNNETLPELDDMQSFLRVFEETFLAYHWLVKNENLDVHKGIITEKLPSEIHLGKFTLAEVLENISDRALRRLVYIYFKNDYPVANYFKIDNEEKFLSQNYIFKAQGIDFEALYLAYVAENNGFAFSVPMMSEMKVNFLKIIAAESNDFKFLPNLYGEEKNTNFIKEQIEKSNFEQLSFFKRLNELWDNVVFSNHFEKEFKCLPDNQQAAIVSHFERAKEKNCLTNPDNKIVKSVTPSNKRGIKIYELRVYAPSVDLRVYFFNTHKNIFIASVCKKSNADQNADIVKACDTIEKLIILHK